MATEKLRVIISATDRATGVLSGVGGAFVGLGKKVGLALLSGTAIAGAAALGFGVIAVRSAGDAEEMYSKFGVTFGEWAVQVADGLGEFAERTGRSRVELTGMAADMGAVIKAMGVGEEGAAELAAGMVQAATDVGSFNNVLAPDVAQRFTRALTGEYESLKALGIVINDTTLKQELLNMGIKGGKEAATNAELIQARYNLIMESSADALGDAERTSGSYTNQMLALKATLKDTTTEIGMKLLPVITPLLAKLGEMAEVVLPVLGAIFETTILPALETAGNLFSGLMSGDIDLSSLIPPEIVEAAVGLKEAFDGFIAVIVDSLPAALEEGEGFMVWFNENMATVIPDVLDTISLLLADLADFWEEHGETIMEVMGTMAQIITVVLGGAITIASGIITAFLKMLKGDWEGVFVAIGEATEKFFNMALSLVGTDLGEFVETWRTNWENAKLIVTTIWDGIVLGIKTAVGNLVDTIVGGISGAWSEVKRFLGISSPSRKFAVIGYQMMEGIAEGVRGGVRSPISALGSAVPAMIGGVPDLGGFSGGGGGGTVVHFHYNPGISAGDRVEMETRIIPLIREGLRGDLRT